MTRTLFLIVSTRHVVHAGVGVAIAVIAAWVVTDDVAGGGDSWTAVFGTVRDMVDHSLRGRRARQWKCRGNEDRSPQKNCSFCAIIADSGSAIAYADDGVVVFADRSPAAALHLLVVPRTHIATVGHLCRNDLSLLQHMKRVGEEQLTANGYTDPVSYAMGFHVPPFTSIDHLHLHVHGLPYKSVFRRMKYARWASWYAHIDAVIEWYHMNVP
ncbi:HIT domain-containing protein [Plasmodiophora brassicae]